MKREEKEKSIASMKEITQKANLLVLADYRGMKVGEIVLLRREIRKAGGGMKVVKNTLFQRALKGTGFENLDSKVDGPVAALFHLGDPIPVLRVLNTWAKTQPKFKIKVGGMIANPGQPGQVLSLQDLQTLANLPTRQVMLAQLVGMLGMPLAKFGLILKARISKLMETQEAVKDEKEKDPAPGA